jgi:hypothetical protein
MYTSLGAGFAGVGAYKAHNMYMHMCQKGNFDKFPKWFKYSFYPIVIQSGMVSGIGVATYTPLMVATCLYCSRCI